MLAIVAAIVFALALLFDLADYASDAINNGTLTVLGLLLIALHFARRQDEHELAPAPLRPPPVTRPAVTPRGEQDPAPRRVRLLQPHLDLLAERQPRPLAAAEHRRCHELDAPAGAVGADVHHHRVEHLADMVAQQQRLHQVDARVVDVGAWPQRPLHHLGQARQRLPRPARHGAPRRQRQADLGGRTGPPAAGSAP